jgi:hypothetical protein
MDRSANPANLKQQEAETKAYAACTIPSDASGTGTDSIFLQVMYENYAMRQKLNRKHRMLRVLYGCLLLMVSLNACLAIMVFWQP